MSKSQQTQEHYCYLLVAQNPIDERKFYFGMRTTKGCTAEEDIEYFGSSKYVNLAMSKGVVFEKRIIKKFETREQASAYEIEMIRQYDAVNSTEFFNLNGGGCGWGTDSRHAPETLEKMGEFAKERWKDPEFRENTREKQYETYARPEVSKRLSEASTASMSKPEVRAKVSSGNSKSHTINCQLRRRYVELTGYAGNQNKLKPLEVREWLEDTLSG
jgi:hypothetical protein